MAPLMAKRKIYIFFHLSCSFKSLGNSLGVSIGERCLRVSLVPGDWFLQQTRTVAPLIFGHLQRFGRAVHCLFRGVFVLEFGDAKGKSELKVFILVAKFTASQNVGDVLDRSK